MRFLDKKSDPCPDIRTLESYAARRLVGKKNERVFLHIKHCGTCLRRLEELCRVPQPDEIIQGRPRAGALRRWWQALKRVFGK